MTESSQCDAVADAFHRRKRYPGVRCHLSADHVLSSYPVTRSHTASVAGALFFWTDSDWDKRERKFIARY